MTARLVHLSSGEVGRHLKGLRTCVAELYTGLTRFGPKQLAKRLLLAVECLEYALQILVEEVKKEVDPEERIGRYGAFIGRLASDLYSLYLEYLLIPSQMSFPAELLLPLRERLCKIGKFKSDEFTFCITQKWKFNNEISLLHDPLRTVAGRLREDYGTAVLSEKATAEENKGPRLMVVLSYPMAEGRNALLHPVLLHEIAHVIDAKIHLHNRVFPNLADALNEKLEKVEKGNKEENTRLRECHPILKQWIKELCADLIATYYFGPSFLCAMRLVSGLLGHFDRCSDSHPDSRLRCLFMLTPLKDEKDEKDKGYFWDNVEATGKTGGVLDRIFHQWAEEAEQTSPSVKIPDEYVGIVREVVVEQRENIIKKVKESLDGECYTFSDQFDKVVSRLRSGIPPDEIDGEPVSLADIFNAGWLVSLKHETQPFLCRVPENEKQLDRCYESLNELMLKAIESRYLLSKAKEQERKPVFPTDLSTVHEFAILGGTKQLNPKKLLKEERIVITPILAQEQVGEASINLRLGSHFLVPKAADVPFFNATGMDERKIQKIQDYVNKSIGEDVVLHPNRLILGQTLEYICLPKNIAGMVLSRSRYGRLGLVVATATFVHPGWQGCLTLELANYGDVPIQLKCGAPIAQIVLFECTGIALLEHRCDDRPPFPTRPGFTQIIRGPDQEFLTFLGQELKVV